MRLIDHKGSSDRRKPICQDPEVDEDGIEIVQQNVAIEHHGHQLATGSNGQIPKSKSTAALDHASDGENGGGALDRDLSQSLQSLQQRVVSLERSLAPFATPLHVPSVTSSPGANPFMAPGLFIPTGCVTRTNFRSRGGH